MIGAIVKAYPAFLYSNGPPKGHLQGPRAGAGERVLTRVGGIAAWGFPEIDPDDGKPGLEGELKNQPGDILCCWIVVEQENRLLHFLENRYHRIGAIEDHTMVKVVINPAGDDFLDIRKIEYHSPFIQRFGSNLDHGTAIMAVEKTAFPVVIQQAVAVAKINFTGNVVHRHKAKNNWYKRSYASL